MMFTELNLNRTSNHYFFRVHDNARANALMQKAIFILNVEETMSKKSKNQFRRYIQEQCSPLTRFYDDDAAGSGGGDELKKVTFQIKVCLSTHTHTHTHTHTTPPHTHTLLLLSLICN